MADTSSTSGGDRVMSARKCEMRRLADASAPERRKWLERGAFFHDEDLLYLKFLIREGARVLELGCGTGDLLAALKPSFGVGVDFSAAMIEQARKAHPDLTFLVGDIEDPDFLRSLPGPFDVIVVVDTLGALDDCQAMFANLHDLCTRETRVVVGYFSHLWYPALKLAEAVGLKMPQPPQNVLSRAEVRSVTVVIPARNERGNIEAAVKRIPRFVKALEIIFVEGGSRDGTWEEIERVAAAHPDHDIKAMRQPGTGKGDAVFAGFDAARGDVVMILDADLTMPPEQLPKFWDAIRSGKGEFVNGSRLIYPMEQEAMRVLNLIANKAFSLLFTWLLSQCFTDTLCGTKALRRSDYARIKAARSYFGDFDPFGDFELIFGASKLGLKAVEIPIRYASRTYGETQISRFRHGFMLLRMVLFAFMRIKAM